MWPQTKAWFQAKHCWYITRGTIGSFRGEPVHYSSSWETTEELQHLVTDALWPITYISQTDGQHIHTANFFLCSVHFHILGFFSTIPIHCTQVSLFFFLACGCLLKQGNTLCLFFLVQTFGDNWCSDSCCHPSRTEKQGSLGLFPQLTTTSLVYLDILYGNVRCNKLNSFHLHCVYIIFFF